MVKGGVEDRGVLRPLYRSSNIKSELLSFINNKLSSIISIFELSVGSSFA